MRALRRTVLLLAVISLLGHPGVARALSTAEPKKTPEQPATSARLLFLSQKWYLASVGVDGQDYRKLPLEGRIVYFDVAQTMDRLLYVVVEQREVQTEGEEPRKVPVFKLFVSDLEGGSPTLITDQVGDPNIYVGTLDPVPLFGRCGGSTYPHWAADGRRILYAGWRDNDGSVPFYVADVLDKSQKLLLRIPGPTELSLPGPTGGEPSQKEAELTKNPFATRAVQDHGPGTVRGTKGGVTIWYCSNVRWHPDGRSITWSTDLTKELQHIWVRGLEGLDVNDPASVTSGTRLPFAERFSWTPNGQRAALIYRFTGGELQPQAGAPDTERLTKAIGHQVLLADRESGKVIQELYRDEPSANPAALGLLAWSPDSTKLALHVNSATHPRSIRIIDLNAPPNAPLVEITNLEEAVSIPPALVQGLRQMSRHGFSADGRTFFFASVVNQGRQWVSSQIESLSLEPPSAGAAPGAPAPPEARTPAGAGQPAATPPSEPARTTVFKHTERVYQMAVVTQKPIEVAVPALPLVIPAAPLEGTLKEWLVEKKAKVERQLQVAKDLAHANKLQEQVKPVEAPMVADTLDVIGFLEEWYKPQAEILDAERSARQGAEEFFKRLALGYDKMTEAERAKVEEGLEARGFALRRFRTVQRGVMRELAGRLARATFERYFTAVARATWAAQELEALVRMWGSINAARVVFHGRYDVYEIEDPARDAERAQEAEKSQKRQFEAMVDMGIAAVLASEAQFEAVSEARKSRLYGLRAGWKDTAEAAYDDPKILRTGAHVVVQLLADGFSLFDLVAGVTADNLFKPVLAKIFGTALPDDVYKWLLSDGFRTRAQKLEDQAMKNWEDTQRKLLVLRLVKKSPLAEVREVAKQALKAGADLTKLRVAPGKLDDKELAKQALKAGPDLTKLKVAPGIVDAQDIALLVADRTFYDATQGGLLRLLSTTLTDFTDRCSMELRIAQDETRLIRRDMAAAYRLEQGQDPETGDVTWGTLLSPMAWVDLVTKNIFHADSYAARSAEMLRKDKQVASMDGLLRPLVAVEFDPGRWAKLAPQTAKAHVALLMRSAPYIKFTIRVDEERTNRALHQYGTLLRRLSKEPPDATKAALMFREKLPARKTELARAHETARISDLQYEDLIYMWDLGSALALADTLGNAAPAKRQAAERAKAQATDPKDPRVERLMQQAQRAEEYADRAKRLREAVAAQHLKEHGVEVFRNVGDMGVMMATFGVVRPFIARPATAALWPAVVAEEMSFSRFLLGSIQPLLHLEMEKAVFTQAVTEVLVDMGVPHTGQKYEALLNQLLGIFVDIPMDVLAAKLAKARARMRETIEAESERIQYAQLDQRRYMADVMNRFLLLLTESYLTWSSRAEAARDPATRASLERQAAGDDASVRRALMVEWMDDQVRRLHDSLTDAVLDVSAKQFLEMRRQLDMMVSPPSIAVLERVLRDSKEDLFRLEHGLDINRLRDDVYTLRLLASKDEQPRVQALADAIDQERIGRFADALGEFLRGAGALVRTVILNGAQAGNPEYRGLFSDLDFTVLVAPGTDHTALQQAVEAAFEKRGIPLNSKERPTSADIEAMIQDFRPGEVRTIETENDLRDWLDRLAKDPGRYLSAGGAEWVGLLNHLTARTVRLQGGTAAIDPTPDPDFVPKPALLPILAHGLVLDVARSDNLRDARSMDTATLARDTAARAKFVLRAVDALIWAVYPDLLRARTREAAGQKGYHALIVEDARRLVEGGLLSPDEFETIQLLVDLKAGKTAAQVLRLEPDQLDAGRARLEEIWDGMNDLMRHAYRVTRAQYLRLLYGYAKTPDGLGPEQLFTFVFRNWNATRRIPPGVLSFLVSANGAPGEPTLLERLKREDRDILSAGLDHESFPDSRPPPVALAPGQPEPEVLSPRQRRNEPSPEADPHAGPTKLTAARAPPTQADPPFRPEEITEPLDLAAVELPGNGDVILNGRVVGLEKTPVDAANPGELLNDVAAYLLGQRLGALVPWATRHTIESGPRAGRQVLLMRWVRSLAPDSAPETDLLGILLELPRTRVPAGFDTNVLAPFKTPEGLERLRTHFIQDLLLSAILGDPDRKSANHVLALGGQLAGIDHQKAQVTEPKSAGRVEIARALWERLKDPRSMEVAAKLGLTAESVLTAWREMSARLFDEHGNVRDAELEKVAALYGELRDQVLATLKARIGLLDLTWIHAEPRLTADSKDRIFAEIARRLADPANDSRPAHHVVLDAFFGRPPRPAGTPEKVALKVRDPGDEIRQRQEDNRRLEEKGQIAKDMQARGVSEQRITWMREKKCPLSFENPQQFEQFRKELIDLLRTAGLDDSVAGMKGTSTAFYSENPKKDLGHHFDADPTAPADVDIDVAGAALIAKMAAGGKLPHPKLPHIYKTSDTYDVLVQLKEFAETWEKRLGREVNFVVMSDPGPRPTELNDYILY